MSDRVYKPKAISGFPEWLPEYRAVELEWLDKIRRIFESYGFCNIETPIVEELDALSAKGGETEKEIYVLNRLHADDSEKSEARLALHFDLTVPMARYVAQHFNNLVFPFKRYQLQKSYRGERPQKGRYREFYQCDIDIVNIDALPLQCDADVAAALLSAYQVLDIPPVEMQLNNRKIIMGFLKGLGYDEQFIPAVTSILDKKDKIGDVGVAKLLVPIILNIYGRPIAPPSREDYAQLEDLKNLNSETPSVKYPDLIQKCLDFTSIQSTDSSFADKVRALGVSHPDLEEGINELVFVIDQLAPQFGDKVAVNLGIIRGLDYYTGTVLEVRFKDQKQFGTSSIGGGGRYEDLAGSFINQKLPGVGASLGLTRLFGLLLDKGLIKAGKRSPTDILVVLPEEARRAEAAATAHQLRQRGFNVELYHRDAKMKNQLAYAEKKGVSYVWFPPFKDGQPHEVKNMATGEQITADAATWTPASTPSPEKTACAVC